MLFEAQLFPQGHQPMAKRHYPQPNVSVKPPAHTAGVIRLSLVPDGGDAGANLLTGFDVLQILLGIAYHDKAAVTIDPVDPVQDIPAAGPGLQNDIPSLQRCVR